MNDREYHISLALRVTRELIYAPGETIWNEYDAEMCVLRAIGLNETFSIVEKRLSKLAIKSDMNACHGFI